MTKNIFLYPLHFKEKVGVNKWNWYMLVCIIPYWEGCSFLIQCNSCLEEKYRVEVFIADLFVLNCFPNDFIVCSVTRGIFDCWILSYSQIGFIIIFTVNHPTFFHLFVTSISNSRTHSFFRLLVLSFSLLFVCFLFVFFINFFSCFFSLQRPRRGRASEPARNGKQWRTWRRWR